MQFTAIMLMTLMTVALTVWMPQRLVEDRVANRSRWLLAAGLALIGVQFALQYAFNFREQGVTQAVFINLLFFIPCSTLISVSILNLQRQGRIRLWEYMTGPVAWIAAATLMITLGQMNGQPLMGDTPEMRNAEMIGSLCYTVMQIVFASLLLTELRRMRRALNNYYDRERSNLLDWMKWSVVVLTVLALMVPVLIYAQNILLAIYALMFFGGIFYLWLQFVGYIRTNAARRMREADENEESMNRSEAQEKALSDGKSSEEALLAEMPIIAEAARRWLADYCHLHSGITIKTAADEMDVHRYQLSAWLKTTKQGNFSQWITYHRIEAAKRLLTEHPDWSNETVAQACGFSTRNYFQTVFKKNTGLSPAEFIEVRVER